MGFSRDSDRVEAETHPHKTAVGESRHISSEGNSLLHLGDIFRKTVSARHAHSAPPPRSSSLSLGDAKCPSPSIMLWLWQPLWKLQVLNEFPPQRKLRSRHVPPATSELPTFLLPLQSKDQTLFHNGRREQREEAGRRVNRKKKKKRIREPHLILIRQSLHLNYTFFPFPAEKTNT